ncbi:flippase [Methylophaga thalassica]|uniref:flippase n=1 Tax=Methylophaga aminisulfidivorans TaxID=230105 RepID=UPI003A920E0B
MLKKILSLRLHKGFLRYWKNFSWLMAEKILRMFVGLTVGVWVARYLGPEQYGLLSYAQSFVFIFSALSTLGLDSIIVRELIKDDSRRDLILGTGFYLKLVATILVLPILVVTVSFSDNDFETNLLILIIFSSTLFQSVNVIDYFCQSTVMSKYVAYANSISLFFSSIAKVIFIIYQLPLIAFAALVVFDAVVVSIGLLFFYQKRLKLSLQSWSFDFQVAKSLLKYSWPMILSGIVLTIQARIDQVMIKQMVGNTEVGYYSVAMRLIELFAFIPIILKDTLYPSIQNAKAYSVDLYTHRLLNFYRLNFILFIITAVPIYLFSEFLVVFLFGEAYRPAGILLALMAIRLFFANMGVARGAFITAENLFKFSLLTMIIGTVVNITLNYFLIMKYQAIGAVIATIISFFITIYLLDYIYSKTRRNVVLQIKSIFTFYKINVRS